VDQVLNFSGFVVDSPQVDLAEVVEAPETFWGHGTMDPAIPYALAVKGRSRLAAAEIGVWTADHNGGHIIAPAELEAAVDWVSQRASGTTPA
jgi:phospholipase/carboxylesterase